MKRLRRFGLIFLGVLVLTAGWASVDRCGEWQAAPGGLVTLARGAGEVRAGAAKAPFELPYPVSIGGYGPLRSEASSSSSPLYARATVLDVGGQRFGLVSLETLLVADGVVTGIREGRSFQVWVVATHTHTGPGGFDRRLAAELAALGSYRPEVEHAVVAAANTALDAALQSLRPAVIDVSRDTHDLTRARSGAEIDESLTRVRFRSAAGAPIAQWLLLGAHPTLAARGGTQLDGDFPSRVAAHFEAAGGVTSVLQTAGGNAAPNGSLEDFSNVLIERVARMADGATETSVDFGLATSDVVLGHPDGSRVGPFFTRPMVENALCANAMMHTEVGVLRLGSISFAAVPAEVTEASAKLIKQQSKTERVLSLANGYEGYLEPQTVVTANTGEAHMQYFGPELLTQLAEAAHQAGVAAGTFGAK